MTAALERGEWSAARPGRTVPPGKTRCPFYRRLCGLQGRSGRAVNLVPTGIRSRTVQPVVSRYTDWATRPTNFIQYIYIYIYSFIYIYIMGESNGKLPQELAQDAVCQSHTGHKTELWLLPARPLRLNTNEWMNIYIFYIYIYIYIYIY